MVWFLSVLAALIILFFAATYICFYLTFYVKTKDKIPEKYSLPPGDEYLPFKDEMLALMKDTENIPFRRVEMTSFDGIKLVGKYYECKKGAPIELMHHGYRGSASRDLCGGVQRCFALERNCLIVDLRASGESGGNVISFGINESRDCAAWAEFITREIDDKADIILTGISMGGATVIMATEHKLPNQVIGVLADCGYTSPEEIIKKIVKQMRLPIGLVYPFIRLGGKIYGGFDINSRSPIKALTKCKLPVMFFHGESDGFVPCEMSRRNFEACASKKVLHTFPGADHGLSFLVDKERYLTAIREFDYKS